MTTGVQLPNVISPDRADTTGIGLPRAVRGEATVTRSGPQLSSNELSQGVGASRRILVAQGNNERMVEEIRAVADTFQFLDRAELMVRFGPASGQFTSPTGTVGQARLQALVVRLQSVWRGALVLSGPVRVTENSITVTFQASSRQAAVLAAGPIQIAVQNTPDVNVNFWQLTKLPAPERPGPQPGPAPEPPGGGPAPGPGAGEPSEGFQLNPGVILAVGLIVLGLVGGSGD